MSDRISVPIDVTLEYWCGEEASERPNAHTPVDPAFTNELTIAVRSDEDGIDPRYQPFLGRAQVHLAGTPRSLEEFGRYLIALARLETGEPDPHDHFEDVQNGEGATVHLIVHRNPPR